MASLAMLKSPRSRFARSINVERDGSNAVDGYLQVGRAIDVIDRLASALYESDLEVRDFDNWALRLGKVEPRHHSRCSDGTG